MSERKKTTVLGKNLDGIDIIVPSRLSSDNINSMSEVFVKISKLERINHWKNKIYYHYYYYYYKPPFLFIKRGTTQYVAIFTFNKINTVLRFRSIYPLYNEQYRVESLYFESEGGVRKKTSYQDYLLSKYS